MSTRQKSFVFLANFIFLLSIGSLAWADDEVEETKVEESEGASEKALDQQVIHLEEIAANVKQFDTVGGFDPDPGQIKEIPALEILNSYNPIEKIPSEEMFEAVVPKMPEISPVIESEIPAVHEASTAIYDKMAEELTNATVSFQISVTPVPTVASPVSSPAPEENAEAQRSVALDGVSQRIGESVSAQTDSIIDEILTA